MLSYLRFPITACLGLFVGLCVLAASAQTVQVLQTNGDQSLLLSVQPSISFSPGSSSGHGTAVISDSQKYQQMDGFGSAFTDSSAWLIYNKLTSTQRTTLMTQLFSRTSGIGQNFMRIPMGASDFACCGFDYTYDDMPAGQTDPNLTNFSTNHDTAYIIPVIQQALSINPGMKTVATTWSAPAWMKDKLSLYGGNFNTQYDSVLANYYVKFLQAYKSYGIDVTWVSAQNEPLYCPYPTSYPTECIADTDEATIIGQYLGPAIQAAGLTTKIHVFDHNWLEYSYALNVLSNPAAYSYSDGTSFHCYRGQPSDMLNVESAYPNKGIWVTECSSGTWDGNFPSSLVTFMEKLFIGSVQDYAKGVIMWNLALDQNNGPHYGGCGTCTGLVTINDSTTPATITYGPAYYAVGQAGMWVQPGAYRIGSNNANSNVIDVAFLNPDGTHVLLACNTNSSTKQTFTVSWNGSSFTYSLPPSSVVTFKW